MGGSLTLPTTWLMADEQTKVKGEKSISLRPWVIVLLIGVAGALLGYTVTSVWWASSISTSQQSIRKDVREIKVQIKSINSLASKMSVIGNKVERLDRDLGILGSRFNQHVENSHGSQ